MKIEIEGRLPSWNNFYSGAHHTERTRVKNTWKMLVREAVVPDEVFTVRVDIAIYAEYKHPPCDSDNVCDKLIIDALKGVVIQDDNPKWVRWTATQSTVSDRNHITVYVTPVGDEDESV